MPPFGIWPPAITETYSARLAANGVITSQSVPNWIDSVVVGGVGDYQITTLPGIFDTQEDWTVQVTGIGASSFGYSSGTNNFLNILTLDNNGNAADREFAVNLWRVPS